MTELAVAMATKMRIISDLSFAIGAQIDRIVRMGKTEDEVQQFLIYDIGKMADYCMAEDWETFDHWARHNHNISDEMIGIINKARETPVGVNSAQDVFLLFDRMLGGMMMQTQEILHPSELSVEMKSILDELSPKAKKPIKLDRAEAMINNAFE